MGDFTPGPCVVGNGGYPHGGEFEVRSDDESDIYITGIQWASPGDPEEGSMPTLDQARVYARLFAAAPTLLDHLIWAEAVLKCWIEGSAQLNAIRAAIAEATGQ